MFDNDNNEQLKVFVGNVEWVVSREGPGDEITLVFRRNGELNGLRIYQDRITRYGSKSVERLSSRMSVQAVKRLTILGLLSYQYGDKLTDIEKAEWQAYLELQDKERQEREVKRKADELSISKRNLND